MKAIYIWQIKRFINYDGEQAGSALANAKFDTAWVKVVDGINKYNLRQSGTTWVDDVLNPYLLGLKSRGIKLWPWVYVYGDNPSAEANMAIAQIQRIRNLGITVEGLIIDAEGQYKGKYAAADTYMNKLRSVFPSLPIALSSYRYPNYHMTLPWKQFLRKCTHVFPQVYWQGSHNPAYQLRETVKAYDNLYRYYGLNPLPMIPVGSAYCEWGWCPTTTDLQEFITTTHSMGFKGISWWSAEHAYVKPDWWQVLANDSWGNTSPPPNPIPPPPTTDRIICRSDGYLSVRNGPGTSYSVVRTLVPGELVTLYNLHKGWVKINPSKEEWCSSGYLSKTV